MLLRAGRSARDDNRPEFKRILTSTTYSGLHYYNRKVAKTGKLKDPKEWIEMACPAIIEPDAFEKVQQHLKSRRQSVTPARLTNGAMMLTQIARCPHCGGGMSLRTGKSGLYRYYACASAASKGTKACKGRSIPMNVLDDLVLSALEEKLLQPARLQAILTALAKRHLEQQGQCHEREKALRKELRQVETAIGRLYDAIENDLVDDDNLFRQRLSERKQRLDELTRLMPPADATLPVRRRVSF